MTPTARSLKHLRELGFAAAVVERWLPKLNRRKDLFGCIDVVAVHPRDRIVLGVQATTLGNLSARLKKARRIPELKAWIMSGCKFEAWGWQMQSGRWHVERVAIEGKDLADVVLATVPSKRRRKGERQRLLFE